MLPSQVDPIFQMTAALAEAIEKKDRCTGGHGKRVAYYAVLIARQMQNALTEEQIEKLEMAALLHDVGKIGIEDRILKKPEALDESEFKVMRTHPELGFQILSRFKGIPEILDGMRFHHERWDGRGYPLGLAGKQIPQFARIVAVADAYDAMVSHRPYRQALPSHEARAEITRMGGVQFDPDVVEAFLRCDSLF